MKRAADYGNKIFSFHHQHFRISVISQDLWVAPPVRARLETKNEPSKTTTTKNKKKT
jgi:hypothetical protein